MTSCSNLPKTLPSAFLSPTPEMVSSMTPTIIAISATRTATPYPLLSPAGAKALILRYIQKDQDCRLPCLWEMTPGKTDLKAAQAFVNQFKDIRNEDIEIVPVDFGDTGGVGILYKALDSHIVIGLSYYQNDTNPEIDSIEMYSYPMAAGIDPVTQDRVLAPIWGDSVFNQELEDYLLSAILTEYGMPSEIIVATFLDDPDRTDITFQEFKLGLLYSEEGFFVEYEAPREKKGNSFAGCPYKAHIKVTAWDVQNNISLKDALRRNIDYYKTLEEATSMSIEEFYQEFKDKEVTSCIETPISIWP
jgi:hypothetical protein